MQDTIETLNTNLIKEFGDLELFQTIDKSTKILDYKKNLIENTLIIMNAETNYDKYENYAKIIDYIITNTSSIEETKEIYNLIQDINKKIELQYTLKSIRILLNKELGKKIFEIYLNKYNFKDYVVDDKQFVNKYNLSNETNSINNMFNVITNYNDFCILINSNEIYDDKFDGLRNDLIEIYHLIENELSE